MLTDKPNIVIAKAPRQIRRKPKAVALASVIVDKRGPSMSAEDLQARGDAADRLFQEIKRRVAEQRRS